MTIMRRLYMHPNCTGRGDGSERRRLEPGCCEAPSASRPGGRESGKGGKGVTRGKVQGEVTEEGVEAGV